ncbi:hypothetical protein [Bacillus cereus]|uniref:hypothetical protein n=1 Tax=Bacillus cereus TaxID=1396 RepID=UPI0005CF44C8|nr:hypothetical protein [Bacillus cereus]
MYGSPFYHEPQRRNVEELRSNNSLEMCLKVGQRLAHPLYVYKIEITKIMAFEEETSYRDRYSSAEIYVKPYLDEKDEKCVFKEYKIDVDGINKDKWFLIDNMEG